MNLLSFLIKIWFFDFNLGMLFSFLLGIGIGMAILVLIYIVIVLSSFNKQKFIVKSAEVVDDEVIKEVIKMTQEAFKDKKLRGKENEFIYCKNLCGDLISDIATRFFPNSKRPLLELSIDEVLMLSVYISNRLDEVLSHRGMRALRKVKISSIMQLTDVKKNIDDNPIVKATKKYKIAETFKAAKKVVNVVNPVFWVRKLIINSMFTIVINKICLVLIGIVGEETYKIYSKNVFNTEATIDTGIDTIMEEIDNEFVDNIKENVKQIGVETKESIENVKNLKKKKKGSDE